MNTITGLLRAYFTDSRTIAIFVLIAMDVVTGIIAALRLRVFRWQAVGDFYRTMVLPGVLGYALVWLLAYFGVDALVGELAATVTAALGAGPLIIALTASILDNVKRSRIDPAPVEVRHMRDSDPTTGNG